VKQLINRRRAANPGWAVGRQPRIRVTFCRTARTEPPSRLASVVPSLIIDSTARTRLKYRLSSHARADSETAKDSFGAVSALRTAASRRDAPVGRAGLRRHARPGPRQSPPDSARSGMSGRSEYITKENELPLR
jgi:hypothetical protein